MRAPPITVLVHLDNPNCRPGEAVTGEVLLAVAQERHIDKILIKAVGYEQTSWRNPHTKHTSWEKHRRELFSAVACPDGFAQPSVVAAGTQLQLPFTFTLPEGLPGSFEFAEDGQDHIRAKIRYKVVVQVLHQGQEGPCRAKAYLRVNEPLVAGAARVAVEDTLDLQAWCLYWGSVHLKANLEQECHVPGDEVVVRLEVDNSESGVSFGGASLALRRAVQLCAGERVHHQAHEVLAHADIPHGEVKARAQAVGEDALTLRLRLPDSVQPTALGELAHSEFSLLVKLKATGVMQAPSLELPLVIFQSQEHLSEHQQAPAGWEKAVVAPVTTLKVPPYVAQLSAGSLKAHNSN